jgi:hypothetical protein
MQKNKILSKATATVSHLRNDTRLRNEASNSTNSCHYVFFINSLALYMSRSSKVNPLLVKSMQQAQEIRFINLARALLPQSRLV